MWLCKCIFTELCLLETAMLSRHGKAIKRSIVAIRGPHLSAAVQRSLLVALENSMLVRN